MRTQDDVFWTVALQTLLISSVALATEEDGTSWVQEDNTTEVQEEG